jgi:hypothetical protein
MSASTQFFTFYNSDTSHLISDERSKYDGSYLPGNIAQGAQ